MKKYFSFISGFFIVINFSFCLVSCKKSESSTEEQNKLRDNAFIVDTASIVFLDSNSISISKTKPDKLHMSGDVFLIPPSHFNSFGDIRKVQTVSETPSQYVYLTESAGLNEAFESLAIAESIVPSFNSTVNARVTDGSFTVNIDKDLTQGITAKGSVNVKIPNLKFDYLLKKESILPKKIHVQVEVNTTGALEITHSQNNQINVLDEKVWNTYRILPPITIVIPIPTPLGVPFPFPLMFSQNIMVSSAPLNLNGSFKYTFPQTLQVILGTKYENETWTDLSEVKVLTSETTQPCSNGFSASVTLDATIIKVKYELKPFDLDFLKANLSVAENVSFKVQTAAPSWALRTFAGIKGSIESKFFTSQPTVFSIGGNFNWFDKSISGNFSNNCNLFLNGNFSQGNSDFATDYVYCNSTNCLFPLADNGYGVANDASLRHNSLVGKDHTDGNGLFMIVNGARPSSVVWKEVVNVSPNTQYNFDSWVCTLIARNVADIIVKINGVQIGNSFTAPSQVNVWTQLSRTWNSGSSTTANVEIFATRPISDGNDFGLDDVSLEKQ